MSSVTYSLSVDRSATERSIVNAIANHPEYANKLDTEMLLNSGTKAIADVINASIKNGNEVTPSYVFTRSKSLFPEPAQEAFIQSICQEKSVSESDFSSLLNNLKAVAVRENVIKFSKIIEKRALQGEDLTEVCSIGSLIADESGKLVQARPIISVGDAMEAALSEMDETRKSGEELGLPYHLKCLNKVLVGMFPSDLVVIAARPSVGKTALALNVAYHSPDGAFGIISSEMSYIQLAKRWMSMETGINGSLLRKPKDIKDNDWDELLRATAKLKGRKFYIEDKGAINIAEIEESLEIWKRLHDIQTLMVDYVQRINSDRTHQSEAERIGYVTKRLKEMAKKYQVCVICLAQINRDSSKENRAPKMSDIKGSGDIEQEADAILIMHKPTMGTDKANEDCVIEAIIEKNRHGPVGRLILLYQPQTINFIDPPEEFLANYRE